MSCKIGVLTSSRADFGIYMPLLHALHTDSYFSVEIIAFGTHLSHLHGYTVNDIKAEGFNIFCEIESMIVGDSAEAMATSTGLCAIKFASFWASHKNRYDYVFCLGDRYEMFAAVSAAIPFNLRLVHFHGGEKTLGAIDNIYRHSISHAASIHFTSTEEYAMRLREMLEDTAYVYNVGALSLDNIRNLILLDEEAFLKKWGIDMRNPTILLTFHPETAKEGAKNNEAYANMLVEIIAELSQYHFVVTMPNADTSGNLIRMMFNQHLVGSNFTIIENFGTRSYFSCMALAKVVLGNSSSGIIEAASFERYNINLGARQSGRIRSDNTFDLPFDKTLIIQKLNAILKDPIYTGKNRYWSGGASQNIMDILKTRNDRTK